MHPSIILRILGILLMLFSCIMLIPLAMALLNHDGAGGGFLTAFFITLISGFLMWLPARGSRQELRVRDGFLITVLFWTVLGVFGALPFALLDGANLSVTDAIFESISGLTTTGATVITGLDDWPRSLLLYRQLLQWLGGIGIIVVAVAILPMLGVGGMQLYQAETPGPSKDSKLTPRITETAKALFLVYVALTCACALAYWFAGMTGFDAICHAFSTVSIGGFSTHDASMGYYESPAIFMVGSFFMFVAAINFGLHFTAWRQRSHLPYYKDSETVFFAAVLTLCITITCLMLLYTQTYSTSESLVHGIFQAISITTTTGYATADFANWPSFLPLMLLMFSFMGGCAGSTGGGIKAMRLMLIYKQGLRELKQLVHPNAVIPLKIGNRRVEAKIISAVWSFFAVYMAVFIVVLILLVGTGLDFETAFSAVAASLNNLGPGLGEVSSHYANVNDPAKWILCATMLLGRLEVFTVLVLFTPAFWRT
ncbi:potassium transporter [Halieaceae bacterium IMCC14734]|uniref:Trk system potassium uptake protein n=1 Tax=Candidatus Litorirhabdus singularis TaxID=2518993 RepID=A0ABT3TD87_9GAMM|nr:TrkH family potassium uptake protein [Candidatus Litorirhabdus singularis]MCX2979954.1 potassium transporter [Candidatus Litorirhabdus singularis]